MSQLTLFPLPYTIPQPPAGLFRDVDTVSGDSGRSDTEACDTRLSNRDVFPGWRRCVVCGCPSALEHCRIVGRKDVKAWTLLQRLRWVPESVKEWPEHESRNGLTMCANHCREFDNWAFFIRFQPTTEKYIFILYNSYSAAPDLEKFHGKAIALDIKDNHAPLPLLFLVHEYMARGRNFYQPTPNLNVTNNFQDWIINDGVINEEDGRPFSFKRKAPPPDPPGQSSNVEVSTTTQATQTSGLAAGQSLNVQSSSTTGTQVASNSGSRTVIMPPTVDLVEELMAYQRTMPSWKAWQREAMSWEGTTEENTKKYVENIGIESAE